MDHGKDVVARLGATNAAQTYAALPPEDAAVPILLVAVSTTAVVALAAGTSAVKKTVVSMEPPAAVVVDAALWALHVALRLPASPHAPTPLTQTERPRQVIAAKAGRATRRRGLAS